MRLVVLENSGYFVVYYSTHQWCWKVVVNYSIKNCSLNNGKSVVFSDYSSFLQQQNRPPRYNWNIVESGVKHHNPNP